MISVVDDLDNKFNFKDLPLRLISLVPSITELLYDLELNNEVIGITKFCVHPTEWFKTKTRIGGTKKVNIEKVLALKPELIIANKEENTKADIETLQKIAPVFITDIFNLNDTYRMIENVGFLTNTSNKAKQIIKNIDQSFSNIAYLKNIKKTCIYLIWQNPFMSVGHNTFINEMLNYCGFSNCLNHLNRYPEISVEDFKQYNPEYILLSSEPYPFKEKHIAELKKISPKSKIILVDGEMFSWYGSRLLKSPIYFEKLLQGI